MPPIQPTSDPGGEAGRVRCLYCGANNFPASASCWQCGRPLKTVPTATAAETFSASAASLSPALSSLPGQAERGTVLSAAADQALANKAAAALGLLFPYVGIPVGIVFLMLDDPRKTQLGWITIGWSLIGSVLNAIALFATLAPIWAILKALPHGGGSPSGLPSIPNMSGDSPGILWAGIPWPHAIFPVLLHRLLSLHV